jgi:polyhydroxyalkanoate synthesis regulator phasin
MPKKKMPESQKDQSARFRAEVEHMIAAGELNATEADERLDRLVKRANEKSS